MKRRNRVEKRGIPLEKEREREREKKKDSKSKRDRESRVSLYTGSVRRTMSIHWKRARGPIFSKYVGDKSRIKRRDTSIPVLIFRAKPYVIVSSFYKPYLIEGKSMTSSMKIVLDLFLGSL